MQARHHFLVIIIAAAATLTARECQAQGPGEKRITTVMNIRYAVAAATGGSGQPLLLDLYQPSPRRGKVPVILFVHGGGFAEGDKHSPLYVQMATAFAAHGYGCLSVNYRLKPASSPYTPAVLDSCIADVLKARAWIIKNAQAYQLDTSAVIICGDSAGGGIVVNTCYAPARAKWFRACIDLWGGLPDTAGQWTTPIYPGPVAGNRPPACIIHGTADRIVPFATSVQWAAKLRKAGVYAEWHPLENADHYPVDLAGTFIPWMISFADRVRRGSTKPVKP